MEKKKSDNDLNWRKYLLYDDFINDKEYLEIKKEIRKKRTRDLALQFSLALIMAIILPTILLLFVGEKKPYIEKKEIQVIITKAINNEADLRAIKQILKNFKRNEPSFFDFVKIDQNNYASDVPLNEVLEDIRTNIFTTDSSSTKLTFLSKLDSMIELHNQVNPFDKLETNQKDYFENIRVKLGSNYNFVSDDVNKLSNELYNKNLLVAEYLNTSNTSFWVSVSALLFAIIISALQLYQNRSSKFHSLVLSATLAAIKDYNKKVDGK